MLRREIPFPEIVSKVRGLEVLDKAKFSFKANLSAVFYPYKLSKQDQNKLCKSIQPHILKKRKFKYADNENLGRLVPLKRDVDLEVVKNLTKKYPTVEVREKSEIELSYESFTIQEILASVLPEDLPPVTSFETIGHICHLNLRSRHEPFQGLIGEVILSKLKNIKTVVTDCLF